MTLQQYIAQIISSLPPLPEKFPMYIPHEERCHSRNTDPLTMAKTYREQTSDYKRSYKIAFKRVSDADAQRDKRNKIVKCWCGANAYEFKLCPLHHYQSFYNVEIPYISITEVEYGAE